MNTTPTLADPATPLEPRAISVGRALALSFSAIIILLAATLLVLALLDRRQARSDLAHALIQRALARTNGDLTELLAPTRRQLAIDWQEVRMGGVSRDDPAAHARRFLPALTVLPAVGSITVGDTTGTQLLLMRYDSTTVRSPLLAGRTDLPTPSPDAQQYFTRDFRPAVRGEQSVWQLWSDMAAGPLATWKVRLPATDRRQQEWQKRSFEGLASPDGSGGGGGPRPVIRWSEVFTFYTTREPGMTASIAARDPGGALVSVTYGILLDELSRYTRAQEPTPNGRVFVVSDSGWLIGHPRDGRFDHPAERAAVALQPVERLGDPVSLAWAAAWRARAADSVTVLPLAVGDARWWGGFRSFNIARGRRFWIGTMVPESDVVATMASQGAWILGASLIALLVAFWLAAGLARRVADPLNVLAEQSARIARFDLATAAAPDSRLLEVRQLGTAIERMRRALVENFAERDRASRALAESESRLLQSQKLEAVGKLAGGVAHDFNNLLTAIRGYAELLRDRLASDPEGLDDLREIELAAKRAGELTSQLLAFSRRQLVEPRIVDVNTVVASAAKLLSRLVGERVAVETVLEPGLPSVRIDPGQLHQVLVNLAINARDAMPEGGRLSITTSRGERSRESGGLPSAPGGPIVLPSVVLRVSDNGVGMPPEVRDRAFEPFFTTKETGRGTGLGLATCWGIVEHAGGSIEIDSTPSEGTVVRVILPSVAAVPTPEPEPPSGPSTSARLGGETILVVEDEAQLRALAERALVDRGFRVLAAPDGLAALELLDATGASIDLLLTDVVMPRMGGPALARKLRERWPAARVLFMTGYAEADAFSAEELPTSQLEVLRKPFTPTELVRSVRRALDGTQSLR